MEQRLQTQQHQQVLAVHNAHDTPPHMVSTMILELTREEGMLETGNGAPDMSNNDPDLSKLREILKTWAME